MAIRLIVNSPAYIHQKMNLETTTKKFTLEELLAAHAKVKTGADFPKYIKEIKLLGLVTYEYMVEDGSVTYLGHNGYQVKSRAKYTPLKISKAANADLLKHTITIHQQGKTDFKTFCNAAAEAGVEKWIIDTQNMFCNYVDLEGNLMVAEPIPADEY
jgi:uncharacterized protein YbcV (DUF1398 family)